MTQQEYAEITGSFQSELDQLQFEQSIEAARFLVVDLEEDDLGALINRTMLGLQLGYILSRTVVFHGPNVDDLDSFYEPFSHIVYDEITGLPVVSASFEIEQFDKAVQFDYQSFWENHRLRRYFYPWAPPEFRSLHCPRLFFDGEFLSRFHLTERMQQIVSSTVHQVDFSQPTVGLYAHNTSSDAASQSGSLDDLMLRVDSICQENDVQQVIVAGDPSELRGSLSQDDHIEFHFVADVLATAEDQLIEAGPNAGASHALSELMDLELLSHCNWIVGSDQSDIARLAAARIGTRLFRCDRHALVSNKPEAKRMARVLRRA